MLDARLTGNFSNLTAELSSENVGGGTRDYSKLKNKPQINDVTLEGNKTSSELGLQDEITSENKLDYSLIGNAPTIPTATSDLTNDGDGQSPFATEAYVAQNGGKIDSISVNNVPQTIDANKNVNISVPEKTSDLNNDSGFITSTANNLVNYYLKSETYTQNEVNALIAAIKTIKAEVVQELPTASADTYFNTSKTIYMVANSSTSGNNYYDEYITIRSGTEGSYVYSWENIGSTQIDLSNYVQKTFTIAGIDMQDNITASELKDALGVKFIVTQGRYIEDDTTKTSSGSIAQTGTTTTEDSGWVQPNAEGRGSVAFGRGTVAGGQEDWNNPDNANHDYAFASGKNAKAYGDSSFAANRGTKVTGANAAAFNESTEAQGKDSFAIGYGSKAYSKGTFATGYYTEARGEYSFTANSGDTNGKYAFATGEETRANAEAASSFGRSTQANGANSMATGHSTVAGHTSSFTAGESTKTSKANQTVVGQYNADDSDAYFIVGDGTADNARSNCFEAGTDGNGNFIKVGNTRFNENEIAKKSNIPSSIDGLGGGTLTSPLNVTGGDSSSSAKIAISNANSGQITDESTHTLFGFTTDNTDTLTIGHNSYKTNIRGSGTRPTYKGDDLALLSDVPIKSMSAGGQALTPDANGNVNIPVGAVNTYGVYKLGQYTNLKLISRFSDYGVLGIDQVTANDIANRLPYKAPTLMNLNDCVKAALSDSNHLTMTSSEQAIAQAVLGITDLGIHLETVASLPTASSTTWFDSSKTIYLAPNSSQSSGNIYDEFVTIRSGEEGSYTYSWEQIGSTEVDLSNYVPTSRTIAGVDLQDNVTKSELLTALNVEDGAEANVIKSISTPSGALTPDANGNISIPTPSDNTYGMIRQLAQGISGIGFYQGGIYLQGASSSGIASRSSQYGAGFGGITPANLNTAVKAALTDTNHLTMTAEEQATAQSVLGIQFGITRLSANES